MDLTTRQIAQATGAQEASIAASWPLVLAALKEFGIDSPLVQRAAVGTIAVECAGWKPVCEQMADPKRQPKLFKSQARYWPWHGRGLIQLTWEKNYRAASADLGVDLVAHPEKALEPETAARIFAWFFKENGVDHAANARDWDLVRLRVNGGYTHLDRFKAVVSKLGEA